MMTMKRINLLPKELRPATWKSGGFKKKALSFNKAFLAIPVVIMAVVYLMWQESIYDGYKTESKAFKKELSKIQRLSSESKEKEQSVAKQKSEVGDELRRLEIRHEVLSKMKQTAVPVSEVLAKFVEVIPENIAITELNLTDKGLLVSGAANDANSVAQLMDKMNGSKTFRNTQFKYTQRAVKPEDQPFSFEIATMPVWEKGER